MHNAVLHTIIIAVLLMYIKQKYVSYEAVLSCTQ